MNHQLIYIAGNHDCDFLEAKGRKVFCEVLQIPEDCVQWETELVVGHDLIVIHGNQFDPANRTNHGCKNSGAVFTSALYHAMLPALRMAGVHAILLAALPAVRPEEESVTGIQHYLNEQDCKKILLGFSRLLQKNGFFTGFARLPSWFFNRSVPILSKLITGHITVDRVRSLLPKEDALIQQARRGSLRVLTAHQAKDPKLAGAIVVAGHTHEFDFTENYVNLGTWIDHIDGLSAKCIEKANTSLPVFVLKEDLSAALYNIHSISKIKSLWQCPILWTRALPN